MGWLSMLITAAAVIVLFGTRPTFVFGIALAMLGVSFTTFCLLYDEPLNRARSRIKAQLGRISQHGAHADEYQRLQSMKIKPTSEDKQFRLTIMSGLNVAAGIAGAALLVWGLYLRLMQA